MWLTTLVVGSILANPGVSPLPGEGQAASMDMVAADSGPVFRPIGSTGNLLTSESRRFWQAVFGWYRVGESVTRGLTREVANLPTRVIRLAVFGSPARPQPIDSILTLFVPRLRENRIESSSPSPLLAP